MSCGSGRGVSAARTKAAAGEATVSLKWKSERKSDRGNRKNRKNRSDRKRRRRKWSRCRRRDGRKKGNG